MQILKLLLAGLCASSCVTKHDRMTREELSSVDTAMDAELESDLAKTELARTGLLVAENAPLAAYSSDVVLAIETCLIAAPQAKPTDPTAQKAARDKMMDACCMQGRAKWWELVNRDYKYAEIAVTNQSVQEAYARNENPPPAPIWLAHRDLAILSALGNLAIYERYVRQSHNAQVDILTKQTREHSRQQFAERQAARRDARDQSRRIAEERDRAETAQALQGVSNALNTMQTNDRMNQIEYQQRSNAAQQNFQRNGGIYVPPSR